MVRAGVLRHRVTFHTVVQGSDEWGQPTEVLVPVFVNEPAEVRDIRGREYWQQQQVPAGEVTTRIRVRYRPEYHRQMVVEWHVEGATPRWFEVEAVLDPDGRRTELHVMCREHS